MRKKDWKDVDMIYIAYHAGPTEKSKDGYWLGLPELSHVNGAKMQNIIALGGQVTTINNTARDFTVVGLYGTNNGPKFVLKSDDGIFDTVPPKSLSWFTQKVGICGGGLIPKKLKWYLNKSQLRLDFAD